MRLLPLDAAVGVLLLAAIILAARRPGRRALSRRVRACGWLLVAGPLPAAVAAHAILQMPEGLDEALFLAGVAAFAVGAALVLSGDEEDWRQEQDEVSPPWWPAFERDLREYELESWRRRVISR
jgi:hypothetical protein